MTPVTCSYTWLKSSVKWFSTGFVLTCARPNTTVQDAAAKASAHPSRGDNLRRSERGKRARKPLRKVDGGGGASQLSSN